MRLCEDEKEVLSIVLQKNNEIINGLTNKQLEDLNEWKSVFKEWFNVLLSTFDVEFKMNKIPSDIKNGNFSVTNLKEILEKKAVNSLELEKVVIEDDIEYKCQIYGSYLKIIEEFNQWAKTNTYTVDLAFLFNELEDEQKKINLNNVRNL